MLPRVALALSLALVIGCESNDRASGTATSDGGHSSGQGASAQAAAGGSGGQGAGGGGGPGGGGGQGGSGGQAQLPSCDPLTELDPATMPTVVADSDGYQAPDEFRREALRQAVTAVLASDVPATLSAAGQAGYLVCGDGERVLLEPSDASGQAWLVLRPAATRGLVIGAPHAWHEPGTLEEAKVIFDQLGARAIVATSTHRCANEATSPCDGTTSVCDASPLPYRISDMAHVDDALFHAAHEALLAANPGDVAISLHGMTRDGVSTSDGSSASTPPTALVALFTEALEAQFPTATITTCNDYGGGNHDNHLCGTTNAQGRFVNGSPNACMTSATANGRFLHLEQHADIRAQPAAVATALAAALPPSR
jgi:hypothetical protein